MAKLTSQLLINTCLNLNFNISETTTADLIGRLIFIGVNKLELKYIIQSKAKLNGNETEDQISCMMAAQLGLDFCIDSFVTFDLNQKPEYLVAQFIPNESEKPFSALPKGMRWVVIQANKLKNK